MKPIIAVLIFIFSFSIAQAKTHNHIPGFARLSHHHHMRHHFHYKTTHENSVSLSAVIPPLAAKAAEIVRNCHSEVISALRPGAHVAGTNRISEHSYGHAVDLRGNAGCIYALLADWPGGYSVDYGAVGHVHVSLDGREDGARFRHGGRRYAGRHRRVG